MGATDSEMGAPEGLLSVFLISGLLLGTCLGEQACVDDACFDQSIQKFKIERSKTDPASGLNYKEQRTDLVATFDVIGVCLPGVNPNVLADTFLSCSNGKVEEVCTMVKRGWLENREGKSVVNENGLLAMFKELNGGEDAVRECLQIPEVYEYEYYYYDYANYFDEYDYDYLEESASGSRQRRAAKGTESKKEEGQKKAGEDKKGAGKGKRSKAQGGKHKRRNRNGKGKNVARKTAKEIRRQQRKTTKEDAKAARRATKKAARRAENKADEKVEKEKERKKKKAARKAKKEANKESSNAEKDARKKALSKLGLKKMPSTSSLEKLTCVQDKITELLDRCAKNILSKTN